MGTHLVSLTNSVAHVPLFVKMSETAPEKPGARLAGSPNEQWLAHSAYVLAGGLDTAAPFDHAWRVPYAIQ